MYTQTYSPKAKSLTYLLRYVVYSGHQTKRGEERNLTHYSLLGGRNGSVIRCITMSVSPQVSEKNQRTKHKVNRTLEGEEHREAQCKPKEEGGHIWQKTTGSKQCGWLNKAA